MKAVLAAISTLGNNKDDLKDLHSPKGKQPRYKALILGTCHLQEPGKWKRQLRREMEQNRKTATLKTAYLSACISGPVSSHFPDVKKTFLSDPSGATPGVTLTPPQTVTGGTKAPLQQQQQLQ